MGTRAGRPLGHQAGKQTELEPPWCECGEGTVCGAPALQVTVGKEPCLHFLTSFSTF